jgi:hypothetical protein
MRLHLPVAYSSFILAPHDSWRRGGGKISDEKMIGLCYSSRQVSEEGEIVMPEGEEISAASADGDIGEELYGMNATMDLVLAELWDNEKDAEYSTFSDARQVRGQACQGKVRIGEASLDEMKRCNPQK